MSNTIQIEKKINNKIEPTNPASFQLPHPIGSKFNLKRTTVNGGKIKANDSLKISTDKPLIGNSRSCLMAQPPWGANFLITLYRGFDNRRNLNKKGNHINTRTYNSQGPPGGKVGICKGSDTVGHPSITHEQIADLFLVKYLLYVQIYVIHCFTDFPTVFSSDSISCASSSSSRHYLNSKGCNG